MPIAPRQHLLTCSPVATARASRPSRAISARPTIATCTDNGSAHPGRPTAGVIALAHSGPPPGRLYWVALTTSPTRKRGESRRGESSPRPLHRLPIERQWAACRLLRSASRASAARFVRVVEAPTLNSEEERPSHRMTLCRDARTGHPVGCGWRPHAINRLGSGGIDASRSPRISSGSARLRLLCGTSTSTIAGN